MYLGYFIGYGAELWHRPERIPFEIHVQSCNNDANPVVGKLIANVYQSEVEKLRFVDTYYIYLGSKQQDTCR